MTIATLPHGVGADALTSITFDTAINPSESGISGRKSMRLTPIRNFTVTIGPDESAAVQEINIAMLGQRYPVGLRDWAAYSYTDEVLAWTTDAGVTTAPLRRKWTAGGRTVYERILIPDESVVSTTIEINGGAPGGSWSIVDPGTIEINATLSLGDVVTASGQYYTAVCFDGDLTATISASGASDGSVVYRFNDVRLRQILEAEFLALTT